MEKKIVGHGLEVGDDVSYGFNGDWYPDGKVAKITGKYLTTTSGKRYFKYLLEDFEFTTENGMIVDREEVLREVFKSCHGGTWTLCKGVIQERNPEF